MSRRIRQLRSGAEARRLADSFLKGPGEKLVLAATRAAADELVWSLGGTLGIHRLTLPQLAANLAAPLLAEAGLTPLSGLAAEAMAARTVHDLRRAGKLRYLQPVADTPGFVRAVLRSIREIRLAGVTAARLAKIDAAGKDLAALLRQFVSLCDAFQVADERRLFDLAGDLAGRARRSPLLGLPVLLFDLPLWTGAAEDLIRRVVKEAPEVEALVTAGDSETVRAMEQILGVPAEMPEDDVSRQIGWVRTRLFATGTAASPPADDGTIDLFAAPGESFECVEIARRILAAAQTGIPFDRIAILLRHPDRYQPLVDDALRRGGIPAFFTRGTKRPDAAGRAFLALIACAEERLSAARFAEYLSLAQVPEPGRQAEVAVPADELSRALVPGEDEEPVPADAAASPAAPSQWEKLLVEAAVIGGADRWRRRLSGLREEFLVQRGNVDEERHAEWLDGQIAQLDALSAFAMPIIDALAVLPESAAWETWLPQLESLARLSLRYPDNVLAALAELRPMGPVGPLDVAEVRSVLAERLGTLREEPSKRRYGAVLVASIEESRGRFFDLVFVPGLAEGLFPKRAAEDPLLLDEARRALDVSLPRRETQTQRERLLLQIASGAGAAIVYSYPSMDTALGRNRVPSLYALEVERARTGTLPGLRSFEQRARAGCDSRLGWPAPATPAKSIDAVEYDLSALKAAQDSEQPRGALRFLVEANRHAARSLRARHKRWEMQKWTDADGMTACSDQTLQAMAARRLTATPYSPTALQHFAACPYRFYLASIARLRPRETVEAIERLDPLTRGEIFHEVQRRLLTTLQETGSLPVTRAHLSSVLTIADQVLDATAQEYAERLAPAIPPVWASDIESLRTDLRSWLRDSADTGWVPESFETRFETPLNGGFQIRGAIDLVERRMDSGERRVVDHKTGRPPEEGNRAFKSTGGGEILQPLLYGLAAEKVLDATVKDGILYFCTQRGGFKQLICNLDASSRAEGDRLLRLIDESIAGGTLGAYPRAGACQRCDYRAVCGPYEERRTAGKHLADVAALAEARLQG